MTRCLSFSAAILTRLGRCLSVALLLWSSSFAVFADGHDDGREVTAEYKLKAALLYKLTKFVTWPEHDDAGERFNLCILGDNVFGDVLEPLRQRQVSKKDIEVNYYSQSVDIESHCDLLFVEQSKEPFLSSILKKFDMPGVLVISDIPGFADAGGMVELTLVNNKVGFRINLASSNAADLSIAAPLLQLATIVEGASSD